MARTLSAWISLALLATACSSDRPAELVGKWFGGGAIGDPNEPGPSWSKEYDLRADGSFVMEGYPPIHVTGKWSVPERDGNRYRIRLTGQKMTVPPDTDGNEWPDEDQWAVLDGNALTWQGTTFEKH